MTATVLDSPAVRLTTDALASRSESRSPLGTYRLSFMRCPGNTYISKEIWPDRRFTYRCWAGQERTEHHMRQAGRGRRLALWETKTRAR